MTLLAVATMMTTASAQQTERIDRHQILTLYGNAEKTDSLYNFWNTYVQVHPKDEVAWRNLFEVSEKKVFRWVSTTKDWKGGEEYRKQLNVVGRMEKAIPGTYTKKGKQVTAKYTPDNATFKILSLTTTDEEIQAMLKDESMKKMIYEMLNVEVKIQMKDQLVDLLTFTDLFKEFNVESVTAAKLNLTFKEGAQVGFDRTK